MTTRILRLCILASTALLPLAAPVACGSSNETATTQSGGPGQGGSAATTSNNGGAGGGLTSNGGGTNSGGAAVGGGPIVEVPCQGHIYQCGDTIDNDMDGLVDWQDPDCLGPCDNTEDSFFGGIPGQNSAPCKADCYFDQDTGAGNDDCYWDHRCDTHEVAPDYYPEPEEGSACEYDPNANIPGTQSSCAELSVAQSQECLDYCGPLTPNGCDCFGCCDIRGADPNTENWVYLGSVGPNEDTVCTLADVDDPTKCHPCDPVPACLNECERCELCVGKTTLPPDCYDPDGGGTGGGGGGGSTQCPPDLQACGLPGQDPCPPGFYCITGCCIDVPD